MNYYWTQNSSIKQLEESVPSLEILSLFITLINSTCIAYTQKAKLVKKRNNVVGGCVYGCCSSPHLSLLQEWFLQRCTYANYSSTNKGSLHKMKGNMKADTVQYFKNSNSKIYFT